MQNLNIKYIVVNGSSKTAAPYNETIRLTQGDNMINVRQIFLKL